MIVYNFGSINIDHVYRVPHFVRPGETMTSAEYQQVLGGKGANQSIALARANCQVKHVGAIGHNDVNLLQTLQSTGVDTTCVNVVDTPTGHAIIQVNDEAENAIVLFAGANHQISEAQIDEVLAQATGDDWVLLQNETNNIDLIIERAKARGLSVAFNPAPMDSATVTPLIKHIDWLIVNEVEVMDLCQVNSVELAQQQLQSTYPSLNILLTLGSQGVRHIYQDKVTEVAAFNVTALDTTAAGDTFIGYCLAGLQAQLSIADTLRQACAASAICVTKAGASSAIPTHSQVVTFMEETDYDA